MVARSVAGIALFRSRPYCVCVCVLFVCWHCAVFPNANCRLARPAGAPQTLALVGRHSRAAHSLDSGARNAHFGTEFRDLSFRVVREHFARSCRGRWCFCFCCVFLLGSSAMASSVAAIISRYSSFAAISPPSTNSECEREATHNTLATIRH